MNGGKTTDNMVQEVNKINQNVWRRLVQAELTDGLTQHIPELKPDKTFPSKFLRACENLQLSPQTL